MMPNSADFSLLFFTHDRASCKTSNDVRICLAVLIWDKLMGMLEQYHFCLFVSGFLYFACTFFAAQS